MGSTSQKGRRERREMYLLLILLVTPTLGRPSSDQLDFGTLEIGNLLNYILNDFSNEPEKIFLNGPWAEEVINILLEAEQNILDLSVELKTMETKEIQFNDTYLTTFNQAKSSLKQARRELRKLAERTVTDVRDMKIFLGALDETKDSSDVNLALKIFMNRMKDLMIETLETLKKTKEKYNLALETMGGLNFKIKVVNRKLEKLVDKESEEYQAWAEKLAKAIIYGGVGILAGGVVGATSTITCLFVDIFAFTFGACSTINAAVLGSTIIPATTAAVVGTLVATPAVQAAIAKYEAELVNLKNISDRMLESGHNFDQAINVTIGVLDDEIDIIGKWTQSAKTVSDNIEEYSVEFLRMFKPIRTIFVNGLDNLKKAAEDFLAQPKSILTLEN